MSASDLAEEPHTLTVRALGQHAPGSQGAHIPINKLVVERTVAEKTLRLIVNTDFNCCRLVRGNYMRKRVVFAAGDSLRVTIAISARRK